MLISDVKFVNFSGWLNGKTSKASVSCSTVNPCYGIEFENVKLRSAVNSTSVNTNGTCKYIKPGGVEGLLGSGC